MPVFLYVLLLFIIWIFGFHVLGEWLVCLCTFCVVVGFLCCFFSLACCYFVSSLFVSLFIFSVSHLPRTVGKQTI